MKKFLFLFVLLVSFQSSAMSVGERRALSVPRGVERNMNTLVQYLTSNISDKKEKAKAIAVWIATHIAYDHETNAVAQATNKNEQTAEDVFKNRVGICVGFVELYGKMLNIAGISNETIRGFVIEGIPNTTKAKINIKKTKIGHVWTKVNVGGQNLLVDVTWMSRGHFGGMENKKNTQARKREFRKNQREGKTYNYEMLYFDFKYSDLMNRGEYRFDKQRKIIKK